MRKPKLFIKYNTSTSLFIHVLIFIFSCHMLSRKYALLKLEIYAVLAENFGEYVTLHLINIIENSIAKYKISLISWMRMKIQIHKYSFVSIKILSQLNN